MAPHVCAGQVQRVVLQEAQSSSASVSVCVCVCRSVYLAIYPSIYPSVYPPVYPNRNGPDMDVIRYAMRMHMRAIWACMPVPEACLCCDPVARIQICWSRVELRAAGRLLVCLETLLVSSVSWCLAVMSRGSRRRGSLGNLGSSSAGVCLLSRGSPGRLMSAARPQRMLAAQARAAGGAATGTWVVQAATSLARCCLQPSRHSARRFSAHLYRATE